MTANCADLLPLVLVFIKQPPPPPPTAPSPCCDIAAALRPQATYKPAQPLSADVAKPLLIDPDSGRLIVRDDR